LATELFKREAGVDIVHVPYRGGGPAVMGLLTGDVDVFINDASTTVENIRAGKLKAVAVAWPTRSPLLPQVPTFAELGFPTVVSSSWFGLAAPADTPADVLPTLAAAMPSVFASAGYQARLEKLGLEQFNLNPEQSAAFIKAEFDKWAEVARSAGIQGGYRAATQPQSSGASRNPQQRDICARCRSTQHILRGRRDQAERLARNFTKLYLCDTGKKTPAPNLLLTGNTA